MKFPKKFKNTIIFKKKSLNMTLVSQNEYMPPKKQYTVPKKSYMSPRGGAQAWSSGTSLQLNPTYA